MLQVGDFLRIENTNGAHNKWWGFAVHSPRSSAHDPGPFYAIVQWGRIGTEGQQQEIRGRTMMALTEALLGRAADKLTSGYVARSWRLSDVSDQMRLSLRAAAGERRVREQLERAAANTARDLNRDLNRTFIRGAKPEPEPAPAVIGRRKMRL